MSEDKAPLVAISDIFGLGKLAKSQAATRLVDAIITGVGELSYPWRTGRNTAAKIEAAKSISSAIPAEFDIAADLDQRTSIRLLASDRRNQHNRENIAAQAVEELKEIAQEDIEEAPQEQIEEDWIRYFWDKAESVSDTDMQGLWSRILARKAAGKSTGLRTLDLLRTLSSEEAKIIESLSQYKIAFGPDHPYWRSSIGLLLSPNIIFGTDKPPSPAKISVRGDRVVSKDGIDVDDRCSKLIGHRFENVLAPIGIYSSADRFHSFALNWTDEPLPVQIGERHFLIEGLPKGEDDGYGYASFGSGIGFSQIGWEVFSLSKVDANAEFIEILKEHLAKRQLKLVAT